MENDPSRNSTAESMYSDPSLRLERVTEIRLVPLVFFWVAVMMASLNWDWRVEVKVATAYCDRLVVNVTTGMIAAEDGLGTFCTTTALWGDVRGRYLDILVL